MNQMTRTARVLGAAFAVPALATLAIAAQATPEAAPAASARIETFDLSTLADGATRSFGEGEHRVTASRRGGEVTIELSEVADGEQKTVHCTIGEDTCQILTTGGGGARTMLFSGSAEGAHASLSEGALSWAHPPGAHALRVVRVSDGPDLEGPDGVVLRCKDGDTTMVLEKDEAAAGYRCPRHGSLLEPAKQAPMVRRVIVERHGEERK